MNQKSLFRAFFCLIATACFSLTAAAIEKDSDGYFLIGSTADLEEFCNLVNTGDTYACARVTADGIDVTSPIGVGDIVFHYRGHFDGQGHTLNITAEKGGLFANAQPGCVISNVNITGTVTADNGVAAALVNNAVGVTIENCNSTATINASSTDTAGGLVGSSRGSITLKGCSFSGVINGGEKVGGLIGWNEHTAHIYDCQVPAAYALAQNLIDNENFVDSSRQGDVTVSMGASAPDGDANTTVAHEGIRYNIVSKNGVASLSLKACNDRIKAIKVPSEITVGDVTYPVTEVGDNSMSYRALQYVEIPASVTRVGNDAFHYSYNLTDVVFDDAETRLWLGADLESTPDQELFYNSPIKNVYIGRNLAWDGSEDEPFDTHDSLREIIFGPRVTEVGNVDDPDCSEDELFNESDYVDHYAFLGDEKSLGTIVKFHCAEGMSHAPNAYISRDLEECKYTEYTASASGYAITDRTQHVTYGPFATVVTPKIFSGIGATVNNFLKSANFDNAFRLTKIGKRAFADCDKITEVNFFNTVLKTIEEEGFYDCDDLSSVEVSPEIEEIGKSAFDDCGITEITLPGTLKRIGYKAFYDCDELTSLSLNADETDLVFLDEDGECRTFDSCKNLVRLYLARNISYKEGKEKASPFYDSYFQQVIIDNTVTKLGQYMFQHSNKLKSMNIGTGIKSIPDNCFNDTEEVTQLNIVDSEEPITLGNSCRSFKAETLYIGRPISDLNNIPSGEKALTYVQFGNKIGIVTSDYFKDFPNLTNLILPKGITVASNAFVNCGIQTIYGQGDATFMTDAFKNCNKIEEVTVVGKLTLDERAFAPADDAPAPKSLNVFFKEDPKNESHEKAFPEKYFKETTLNNLYDTPYQSVDFTHLPWAGFVNRNSFTAHDYAPTTEAIENGKYDHAYIRNEHEANQYFSLLMPFDVSTYYFGTDVTAYSLLADEGFNKELRNGELTLSTRSAYDVESKKYFYQNSPFIIKSSFKDDLVRGTFDQFKTSQVYVRYIPDWSENRCSTPFFVSDKDEVINPSLGHLYVIDDGCLKLVNGDYYLPAFSVAFKTDDGVKLRINDNATGEPLLPQFITISTPGDLMGLTPFCSYESDFIAEGAEVYTVGTEIVRGKKRVIIVPVKDNVINKGQPVLIKNLSSETLTLDMVTSPSTDITAYQENVLKWVDTPTPLSELGPVLLLAMSCNEVGFVSSSEEGVVAEDGIVPANSVYIEEDNVDVDPEEFYPVITGVNDVKVDAKDSTAFDLQGRRVNNTENNTIYIIGGAKIIKK